MTRSSFGAHAELLIEHRDRASGHGATERTGDPDQVMPTVANPSALTWSGSLCWACNYVGPDGQPELRIFTTPAEVRSFYAELLAEHEILDTKAQTLDIRGDWYVFSETPATRMRNTVTGEVHEVDSAVLTLFDGGEGISAEIGWNRYHEVALGPGERADRWNEYFAALRRQDVSDLSALMAPSVQGAVRDYFDASPPLVAIHGRDEMRAWYEKLLSRVEIIDITPVRLAVRDWFVFAELRWIVRSLARTDQGRELRFLTAEHLVFGSDGLFQGRLGYGTEME